MEAVHNIGGFLLVNVPACVCVYMYPPVVLGLEKLELLLDAVQRFWDGELKGLARSLVGRLKQTRTHTGLLISSCLFIKTTCHSSPQAVAQCQHRFHP